MLALRLLACHKFTRILNQKLMKTEKTSIAQEVAAAKQAWHAPTVDCLSVSLETAAASVFGMDGMANASTNDT